MNRLEELYVDSIEFSYSTKKPLLTGAYLQCSKGDIVGLLGRNGCGKSTLMKIVFGAIKAQNSYILVQGQKTEQAYLSRKVGYLPQESFLPTHEKVAYMIELLVEDPHAKQTLLEDIRINSLQEKKIHQLSGGELRYLEICLLIHQPTDFLLLDEPFTGIEPLYIQKIKEMLLCFKDRKGFVISDHDYRSVLDITNHILLLQNGTCRTIRHQKELEFLYLPEGTF